MLKKTNENDYSYDINGTDLEKGLIANTGYICLFNFNSKKIEF